MKKILLVILFLSMTLVAFPQESKLTFWIYGVDPQITQKYEGLFQMPHFEFMGGAAFGDYVYVVTLITTISDKDYYCVGIITSGWFNKAVEEGGFVTATVFDRLVSLSYKSVRLIRVPF